MSKNIGILDIVNAFLLFLTNVVNGLIYSPQLRRTQNTVKHSCNLQKIKFLFLHYHSTSFALLDDYYLTESRTNREIILIKNLKLFKN